MKAWRAFIFLLIFVLTACSSSVPTRYYSSTGSNASRAKTSASSNACTLFQKNPDWYWEALDTYNRWGVPVSVQMAIMQRESDFQAGARPPTKQLFGFIPWGNVTSAYGYAQAINGTWQDYQRETKQYDGQRDQFGDASDFIGWYCSKAHKQLGIPLNNAYDLYLAYHEGLGGYANQTYLDKPWLIQVAQSVQNHANQYRDQIAQCKYYIPKVNIDN